MQRAKKLTAVMLAAAVMWTSLTASAEEDQERIRRAETGEVFQIMTTGYCHGEITAAGRKVRPGICAARREWMGKTVLAWKCQEDGRRGEFLGYWECLDTGFGADSDGDGIGSIQEGRVIDMYFPTLEGVQEWMDITGGRIYIQMIDAEG